MNESLEPVKAAAAHTAWEMLYMDHPDTLEYIKESPDPIQAAFESGFYTALLAVEIQYPVIKREGKP